AMAELVRQRALPASAATVCLAGEPLPRRLVEEIYSAGSTGTVRQVWNLYGPSEDTTYSTAALVAAGSFRAPSIGRPVAGSRVHLLDLEGERTPLGVPGELYLARPELTAERFVPDPFAAAPGERLYRTGDLARHRPDGSLDFLGRIDSQV